MTEQNFQGQYPGTVQYIDTPVFIFSPAPFLVNTPGAPDGYYYTLTVVNQETGKSYTETRQTRNGVATFELSAILQHLMSFELSEALSARRRGLAPIEGFEIELHDTEGDYVDYYFVKGCYGTLDQLETFRRSDARNPDPRRVWLNYPQTFLLWKDAKDSFHFDISEGTRIYPTEGVSSDYEAYECNLMDALRENPDGHELLGALQAGIPATIGLSNYYEVDPTGEHKPNTPAYYVRLLPDSAPLGEGTYLRWLHHDGSIGYWHFQNGALSVAAAEGKAFQRFVSGNPAEPAYTGMRREYESSSKADLVESRVLQLGTYVNNAREFDYLCGLATSPVIDRYVLQEDGQYAWQRVNIVPGSYAKNYRRNTPSRSAFEISIKLPQRNTILL